MLKIRQGLGKSSASKTDIYIAEKDHRLYIIKLFVKEIKKGKGHTIQMGEDYLHELMIYQRLTQELISNSLLQIRNIVPLTESLQYTFHELLEKLNKDLKSPTLSSHKILRNLVDNTLFMIHESRTRVKINQQSTFDQPLDMNLLHNFGPTHLDILSTKYMGIVTPKMDQCSFSTFFQEKIKTIPEFMDYLFLILITQLAMSEIGINQNDLHWGNILVDHQYLAPHQTRHYLLVYKGFLIWIDKPSTPYIYDFDRASIQGKYIQHLRYLKHGGNCPTFHKNRDLLKTLCCSYHACMYKSKTIPIFGMIAQTIMKDLILSSKIRKNIALSNASCWMATVGQKDSILCQNKDLDRGMKSWDECIQWVFSQTQYKKIPLTDLEIPPTRLSVFSYSHSLCQQFFSIMKNIDQEIQRSKMNISTFLLHNFQFMGSMHHLLKDPYHQKTILCLLLHQSYLEYKQKKRLHIKKFSIR